MVTLQIYLKALTKITNVPQ